MSEQTTPKPPSKAVLLATSSPRVRAWLPTFWFEQRLFALLVVVGAGSLAWIYPLSLAHVSAEVERYLSLLNLLLWAWAVADAAVTLAALEINHALAAHVYREGEEFLRNLRAGQAARMGLDELSVRFLPSNPTRPAVTRLFEHIVEDAKDRQFNFSGNVVRLYREESSHAVVRIERLQQLTLRLGILGTFIGLGTAMHAIPGGLEAVFPKISSDDPSAAAASLDASREVFVGLAQNLSSALSDAFGTSISGLACSASIWALAYALRRKQFGYFSAMDRAAEVITSLSRNALNVDEFHENFRQLIVQLDELKTQLYDRVGKLSASVVELDGKVNAQTSAVTAGLDKLRGAGGELDVFLKRLSLDQTQVLRNLELLFERAELRQVFGRLEASVEQAGLVLGGKLESQASVALERTASVSQGIADANDRLEKSTLAMDRLIATLGELGTRLASLRPGPDPGLPPSARPPGGRSLTLMTIASVFGGAATLLIQRAFE